MEELGEAVEEAAQGPGVVGEEMGEVCRRVSEKTCCTRATLQPIRAMKEEILRWFNRIEYWMQQGYNDLAALQETIKELEAEIERDQVVEKIQAKIKDWRA